MGLLWSTQDSLAYRLSGHSTVSNTLTACCSTRALPIIRTNDATALTLALTSQRTELRPTQTHLTHAPHSSPTALTAGPSSTARILLTPNPHTHQQKYSATTTLTAKEKEYTNPYSQEHLSFRPRLRTSPQSPPRLPRLRTRTTCP